jgi:hypothetical protein
MYAIANSYDDFYLRDNNVASLGSSSENISDYFSNSIMALWSFDIFKKRICQKLFQGIVTKVSVDTDIISGYQEQQISTTDIAKGSLEGMFVDREHLHETLQIAQSLINQIFNDPSISYEYCCDHGDKIIEWLDVNLHYNVADDAEIETLLDKMDELNEAFSDKVNSSKELMLNFHLDII